MQTCRMNNIIITRYDDGRITINGVDFDTGHIGDAERIKWFVFGTLAGGLLVQILLALIA